MKRLWGVRHIRWLWLGWRVHVWAWRWAEMGVGLGYPNESDLKTIDAIWRGEV